MLPLFLSQIEEVEEVEEVQPLQTQQHSRPATVPTDFIEPTVVGSLLADVEEELAALLENVRTPEKEVELSTCRSVESLSSSYRDSSAVSSYSSDNGEDIESNTEEIEEIEEVSIPVENEPKTVAEVQPAPEQAPERPASCPPMGISQKFSIREIRDPRLQNIRAWAQQSESLAMAEEPSTSSDSESHSEEGDYDYDLEQSPPLSPISSAGGNDGEWGGVLNVESLDKMENTATVESIEGEIEVVESEVVEGEAVESEVVCEIERESSKDELMLLAPPAEIETPEVELVSAELPTEKAEEIITIQEISEPAPAMISLFVCEELPPVEVQEMETEKIIITIPEAIKSKVAQAQKKKRKLPMKQRLRNSRKKSSNKKNW